MFAVFETGGKQYKVSEGDIVKIWADPKKANEVLGWRAEETLEDTMLSAWKWQLRLRERGIM